MSFKGFLFDENLPRRLTFLASQPIIHSETLGISISDSLIWNYARANSLVIVTKDADFSHRIMMSSPPPWIVHLRFGNLTLKAFHALLSKTWPSIEALLPEHKLICIYLDRIEGFREIVPPEPEG